jgi:hypothetical protein
MPKQISPYIPGKCRANPQRKKNPPKTGGGPRHPSAHGTTKRTYLDSERIIIQIW